MTTVERLARTILYEGYVLFPYRASSLKNRARFSFGGLVPRDGNDGIEPSAQRVECLLEAEPGATLGVEVAFLQPVDRCILDASGAPVAELDVDGDLHVAWEEAVEQRSLFGPITVEQAEASAVHRIEIPGGRVEEAIRTRGGAASGLVVRTREPIAAEVKLAATRCAPGLFRVRLDISNEARRPMAGARLVTMHATHAVLRVRAAAWVSSIDPPTELAEAASSCSSFGAYPVLVGRRGERDTLLASPIILYDYPALAPESPRDLFDATENDELLTLGIAGLGAAERREAEATDDRVRAVVAHADRLASVGDHELHGAVRSLRTVSEERSNVRVGEVFVGTGDRVRLHPRGTADVFDLALSGRTATIVDVHVDVSDRLFFAVVVDGDPGRDFGQDERGLGHRFFVGADEVEAL